ncbi:hypothetical protein J5226_20640 [Lysobacter sp. K5869]|uniref:hypothetical protein n=1 Tax=Lysobacter sp. K5869 TaxID=2820808 RepID=UPI001C060329|nr:hypothetical protein [Lysobacter sp. K5869]QWP75985.1 hypothetical protein J5226_20640 [Lysobacter sp. K5869]
MRFVTSVVLIALGVLLGVSIGQGYAASQGGGQLRAASCDDTKLGEIADFVKKDPASSAQLKRAVAGDAEAALNLAVMFGKIDFAKMMCFERMAAENGGKVSQDNYGKYLLESKDPLAQARGKYWVDKSKRPGKGG